MGAKPAVVAREEFTWARDHSLQVSQEYYHRFLPAVDNFHIGSQVQMCSRRCDFMGIRYYHHYITNGTWVVEFGGGEISDNTVEVHNRRMPSGGLVEKTFTLNSNHIQRMKEVIGATNYSICLRNCEHVARYIHSGAWICMQMLPERCLSAYFQTYMMGESKKLINQLPTGLASHRLVHQPLYPGREGIVKLITANKQGFSVDDEAAFNVVVVGPTGSGKSSIINRLFNKKVSREGSSAVSVTREMTIFEGEAEITTYNKEVCRRKLNIIDTIGFCDSAMKPDEVVQVIKFWLKVQKTTIDKIIVVLSGRIEAIHAASIKDLMTWLDFERRRFSFVFVYNKADLVEDEATLCSNIAEMSQALNTGFKQWITMSSDGQREVLDLNMSLGIPPSASYEESQEALAPLENVVFRAFKPIRVPVNTETCSIL